MSKDQIKKAIIVNESLIDYLKKEIELHDVKNDLVILGKHIDAINYLKAQIAFFEKKISKIQDIYKVEPPTKVEKKKVKKKKNSS